MVVIDFCHCESRAAIHGCAFPAMDRHGLQTRDDEGMPGRVLAGWSLSAVAIK